MEPHRGFWYQNIRKILNSHKKDRQTLDTNKELLNSRKAVQWVYIEVKNLTDLFVLFGLSFYGLRWDGNCCLCMMKNCKIFACPSKIKILESLLKTNLRILMHCLISG